MLAQFFARAQARSMSTPDLVAQALRDAIIAGHYVAGQPLRQDEIADVLQVSKIPIREALRRLEAEGLVVFHANRGAVVAPLSVSEAEGIAEIRVALETLALRLAIPQLTVRDLRLAQGILDDLDEQVDVGQWGMLNRDFHHTLYAPSERVHLLALITTQYHRFDRYMRVVLAAMQHQAQSQAEHRALLAACMQRDAAAAVVIVEEHIMTAARLFVAQFRLGGAR